MPWHDDNSQTEKEMPSYPGLPTKRTPIKGMKMYCSLQFKRNKIFFFFINYTEKFLRVCTDI